MSVKSAQFAKSITGTADILYDGKFQFAFLGRSNVGKSSLINALTQKKNLAKTSSNPGKTVRMEFFLINGSFYFVDFPGYGYARRSWNRRDKLAKMILWYLMYSGVKDRLVVLIIDANAGVTDFDRDVLNTIYEFGIDHIVVANKVDKLKMGQKDKQLSAIQSTVKDSTVIPFSSKQKNSAALLTEKIWSYTSIIQV